ncbi:hypothetical protein GCM10018980_65200 [Streptomyces capoamus]|uniref:DUF6881 domain-containing protein n=1 Tax=Streptomyces capoamus TaxID=68183 RepID=A0A919F1W6_9ACTN|nr:hypothetical protein [Streptomyces capoamus]GGP31344.1 hypothetical protein GCM10010501_72030 [Streptomyces libani subsp. rufus]GHG70544.1 hypothetical protein GCM10018980_65200 [Streptomyces capoamus]
MEHWKVDWAHELQSEPVRFYSEIGSDGYEVRKIQVYRDGQVLKADMFHESAEIGLSEVPAGSIDDVASQPEFSASAISPEEFERAWRTAQWSTRNVPGRR